MRLLAAAALSALLLLIASCDAPIDETDAAWRYDPTPADSSTPSGIVVADGLELAPWARLPGSPVTVRFDDQGRAFVTQTARRRTSDLDIRSHPDWMVHDLSFETVDDQRAFYRRTLTPDRSEDHAWLTDHDGNGIRDWRDLGVVSERVLRLEDTDDDGRADDARLFADGFRSEVTGVAGSVQPLGGDVFLTVEPDVWRLTDIDDDGTADRRHVISTGYGVHIGFGGHGMSALTVGPDGKVYWAIGDLGASVVAPDGELWHVPDAGAVFRANPDGSDFEVFAYGLRNTHEIAFDDHGNLIAVDNDGDHVGEDERVVYITDGSDSGWRTHWQFGKYDDPENTAYKVWMDEGLHRQPFEGRPAYVAPPVAGGWTGPAGFAYNPGTALGAAWRGMFFTTLFTGDPSTSGVLAFRLQEEGAGFALVEERSVLEGVTATGLGFGPDGALYLADWITGWDVRDEGRIWRLVAPGAPADLQDDTQARLAEDVTALDRDVLSDRLAHPDQRVRLKAQFEFVRRKLFKPLFDVASEGADPLARLHAVWGLGQLAREAPPVAGPIAILLTHDDAEVRAQTARVIGDAEYPSLAEAVRARLTDPSPRVRFFVVQALGRIGDREAVSPLVDLLARTDDRDPTLAYAIAVALARIGDVEALAALTDHAARSVRLGAVVALRRIGAAEVERFLDDPDPWVVAEAARAIHDDASIEAALPTLATLIARDGPADEATLRRAINANLRLGTAAAAERLAAYAARAEAPAALRAEALAVLATWPAPLSLDRVEGRYRDLGTRDEAPARSALALHWQAVQEAPVAVRAEAVRAAGRLHFEEAAPTLSTLVRDSGEAAVVRTAALQALAAFEAPDLPEALAAALAADVDTLRTVAHQTLAQAELPAPTRVDLLAAALDSGRVAEQQSAFAALGTVDHPSAHALLERWIDRLHAGTVPPALHLDVLEAAQESGVPTLMDAVRAYEAAAGADPVGKYRAARFGGDPQRGRRLFFENTAAQCARCHAIGGEGGDVGPDLAGVGSRLDREALLAALVAPGETLALGYGTVALTLHDGAVVQGTLVDTTAVAFVIEAGGARRTVPRTDVAARQTGPSSMPPMGALLDARQLRDLVAYLATR